MSTHNTHSLEFRISDEFKVDWICNRCSSVAGDRKSFAKCSRYNMFFSIKKKIRTIKSRIYRKIADYFHRKAMKTA